MRKRPKFFQLLTRLVHGLDQLHGSRPEPAVHRHRTATADGAGELLQLQLEIVGAAYGRAPSAQTCSENPPRSFGTSVTFAPGFSSRVQT